MDNLGMGTGLAALGFWIFIATIIAVCVWGKIRKRESEHETLRRIVESGQPIDDALTDKLLAVLGGAESKDLGRDLKVGSDIMLALVPGLAVLGLFMGLGLAIDLLYFLLGVSSLMLCLGLGMFVASNMVWKQFDDDFSRTTLALDSDPITSVQKRPVRFSRRYSGKIPVQFEHVRVVRPLLFVRQHGVLGPGPEWR